MSIGKHVSNSNKVRNLDTRMAELEDGFKNVVAAIDQLFQKQGQRLGTIEDVLEAAVKCLGEETVKSTVTEIREEKAASQVAQAKANLAAALEAGQIAPADTIGEKSIISGVETDKDGNAVPPGYLQVSYESLKPELKAEFLGKSVGTAVQLSSGGSYDIQGVFDVVEQAQPAEANAPFVPPTTATEPSTSAGQ